MNYVEQFYSTNIKLRAFEDALAETMVLIQIFVTVEIRYSGFELGGKSVLSDRLHSDSIKSILPPRDTLYLSSHVCTKIH